MTSRFHRLRASQKASQRSKLVAWYKQNLWGGHSSPPPLTLIVVSVMARLRQLLQYMTIAIAHRHASPQEANATGEQTGPFPTSERTRATKDAAYPCLEDPSAKEYFPALSGKAVRMHSYKQHRQADCRNKNQGCKCYDAAPAKRNKTRF